MQTLIKKKKKGIITDSVKSVSLYEGVSPEEIAAKIIEGKVIIPYNSKRKKKIEPRGVGEGLFTKVNANIGTSPEREKIDDEIKKVKVAISAGADSIMDLSTGKNARKTLKRVIAESNVMVGTVPIYLAAVDAFNSEKSIKDITKEDFFRAVEEQLKEGVDFVTIHCGITLRTLESLKTSGRITGIVSRGGSILAKWMTHNERENPFYEDYSRLVELLKKYDAAISLGDGLRPGCLADATDRPQVQELVHLGELAKEAFEEGVQVMIEGPGHVPLDQIETNIKLQKKMCNGAPFYVLGPLVTDIAPGYDHITSAIGGAYAGMYGADFLCYVTPSEHLRLPTVEDVKEAVIVARIAAHAADIAKGKKGAIERDNQMAAARKRLDWDKQIELSIDPEKASNMRKSSMPQSPDVCTMCGVFCSMKENPQEDIEKKRKMK
ncbi:MAG: phosphomethylpyrimidine synthase ThiC [Candidatus Schekmanbacteria bacterium]|nr:MAG: phosphomethylpyrimidine synthase ThiC [Candidatus Schekmanbacteria bacterium]